MAISFDQLSRHLQNIKTLNKEITIANSYIHIYIYCNTQELESLSNQKTVNFQL